MWRGLALSSSCHCSPRRLSLPSRSQLDVLETAFESLDDDSSGYISYEEMNSWFRGRELSAKQVGDWGRLREIGGGWGRLGEVGGGWGRLGELSAKQVSYDLLGMSGEESADGMADGRRNAAVHG